MAIWVIDRFEEDWVILQQADSEEVQELPRKLMPKGAREGNSVYMEGGAWLIDHEDTARRKERISTLFNRIRARAGKS